MISNLHKATITAGDQVITIILQFFIFTHNRILVTKSSSWKVPRCSSAVCTLHLRRIPLHCHPTPCIFTFLLRDQFPAPSPVNHKPGEGEDSWPGHNDWNWAFTFLIFYKITFVSMIQLHNILCILKLTM